MDDGDARTARSYVYSTIFEAEAEDRRRQSAIAKEKRRLNYKWGPYFLEEVQVEHGGALHIGIVDHYCFETDKLMVKVDGMDDFIPIRPNMEEVQRRMLDAAELVGGNHNERGIRTE